MNDVLVQKITSLQRCVARARDARARAGENFNQDFDLQDSVIDQDLDNLLAFAKIVHESCQP